ncbi:hypothetical protein [Metallosphaera hakonensis]|uniref:Uncharacterized protein n=1 Tax=Metallosphaera hakonensis JCM 8857 = DSM 7519 TaxID=1293036 RepID=A0A2U9ISU0_9CREN|nr:hypothetical protein [Metallosphaera hakonensis]AWR99096.1 hypothetical protein DFR87_04630 [Metallosphaera hakonensis JCM 8857 = DSM 7519]
MTLVDEISGLLKEGKPLFALMLIKQYVEDNVADETSPECSELITAVRVMPWMNDESWRYFAPSLPDEEIKTLALRVQECVGQR